MSSMETAMFGVLMLRNGKRMTRCNVRWVTNMINPKMVKLIGSSFNLTFRAKIRKTNGLALMVTQPKMRISNSNQTKFQIVWQILINLSPALMEISATSGVTG